MSDRLPPMPGVPTPGPSGPKGFVVKHKVWSALIALFAVGVIMTAASPSETTPPAAAAAPSVAASEAPTTTTGAPTTAPTTEAPAPPQPPQPQMTVSQENAVESAQSYLDYQAFSKLGLIDQLSSKYGEGFPKADAIFAVNHINVNWNEQAAKSAKDYLKYQSFSRDGLIQQLESAYGEQFTHAEAVYGVNQTGL